MKYLYIAVIVVVATVGVLGTAVVKTRSCATHFGLARSYQDSLGLANDGCWLPAVAVPPPHEADSTMAVDGHWSLVETSVQASQKLHARDTLVVISCRGGWSKAIHYDRPLDWYREPKDPLKIVVTSGSDNFPVWSGFVPRADCTIERP